MFVFGATVLYGGLIYFIFRAIKSNKEDEEI